jgi:NitT/TauT family transport system ATP-binding protein
MTLTSTQNATTLAVDGVTKRFPTGTVALTDVSLSLAPGDFVTVVGPSGCGKSTLLRLASGLEEPTGGTISVSAASTSYVFQDATLLEWRSALTNVELVGELRGEPKAERRRRAQEALDLVGLTGFEAQHPRSLSGGMRMRVSLARALVAEPELALFDEPFGAVYLSTRVLVMSGRPGRIVAEIPIPWDYPREPDLRHTAEFAALTGRVSHTLGEHS